MPVSIVAAPLYILTSRAQESPLHSRVPAWLSDTAILTGVTCHLIVVLSSIFLTIRESNL